MNQNIANAGYCVISKCNGEKADYAKLELEKYIFLLTGIAPNKEENSEHCDLTFCLQIDGEKEHLGEEGYEIHTSEDLREVTISAFSQQGILYGVYGLLDDHYGVGFYFSGDAISGEKSPLPKKSIRECKIPAQYIRGILPWTNFPQSATSYSIQDWIYIIDQMTRMRFNFINIHNYNGEFGHNEIFHNIMVNGEMSRNWNATVAKPHAWGIKGFDVNKYLFGGSALFDDYDFGADATLHNDCLDNIDVFKKGSSEFQIILDYAHKRGVKIGLGLDLNLVAGEYGSAADDERIAKARVNQIITDYANLDYLMLYRSENSPDFAVWNKAFQITYREIKQRAAGIRIAVSGWGLDPDTIIGLPKDVIAAPISGHSVNDKFPDGSIYGEREFWACPWAERDYNDSLHFAPYETCLSNTIACYQNRSSNTRGLMTLTWRLSDGVDAKLAYIAQAPWDEKKLLSSSEAAYEHYAEHCYGHEAAPEITKIINQNEAYATNASECVYTPRPTGKDRSVDIEKAVKQLAVLDQTISKTTNQAWAERLKKLRCRIQAVHSFCILDERVDTMEEEEKYKEFSVFIKNFINRIDDISTLGNLFSVENRYVQEWYKTTSMCSTKMQTKESLRVLMISPPTVLATSNDADFKAIVLPGTAEKKVKVSLLFRAAGDSKWNEIAMERRVKQIFGIRVKASQLPNGIIEYCIRAADEEEAAFYPATAPTLCMAISKEKKEERKSLKAPMLNAEADGRLRWRPCDSDTENEVHWYRIYRGTHPDFAVGPQSLVTYVYRDTLTYLDVSPGFDGQQLQGTYYYKVSGADRELFESEPSVSVCCHRTPPVITPVKSGSTEDIKAISLGRMALGERKSLWLTYGASGPVTAHLWIDRTQENEGVLIGTATLCATGGIFVQEMGEILLKNESNGVHEIMLTVEPSARASWKITNFCMGTSRLREPVIRTESDAFAMDAEGGVLRVFADDNEYFQVKKPNGGFSESVHVDENGTITSKSPEPVRVIAASKDGIITERLIGVSTPVAEEEPVSFDDFWLISKLAGFGEHILVGGLANGFEYTCQVRRNQQVLYVASLTSEGSFLIPASIVSTGNTYDIAVTAFHQNGYEKEIIQTISVTDQGLFSLTDKTVLSADSENGSIVYTDDWGTQMKGRYSIAEDGLHLSVAQDSAAARFTFCLPEPYTREKPYLLIRASTISGSWNMQFNGVPVVGPKENGIAVRKDMRIFGFEEGDRITLSLFVLAEKDSQVSETIFHSIQLLPY